LTRHQQADVVGGEARARQGSHGFTGSSWIMKDAHSHIAAGLHAGSSFLCLRGSPVATLTITRGR
jgi:hypothetical protein